MSSETTTNPTAPTSNTTNALRDNIVSKGKNAYYFAHSKTPKGPTWDGQPEPKLLAKHSFSSVSGCGGIRQGNQDTMKEDNDDNTIITNEEAQNLLSSLKENKKKSSYDIYKSNITKYSFLDEGKKIKIYVDLKTILGNNEADKGGEGGGDESGNGDDKVNDETDNIILNYDNTSFQFVMKDKQLCFGKLYGEIQKASYKKKNDKVIITLVKKVTMAKKSEGGGEEGKETEGNAEYELNEEEGEALEGELEVEEDPNVWTSIGCKNE